MTEYSEKRYLYGTLSVTHCGISNPSAFLKTMYSYLKKNPANIQMSGMPRTGMDATHSLAPHGLLSLIVL